MVKVGQEWFNVRGKTVRPDDVQDALRTNAPNTCQRPAAGVVHSAVDDETGRNKLWVILAINREGTCREQE